MTIDSNGRAHRAAGSPASTGGQYAAQAAPGAAATLALDPEYDLETAYGREMQRVREMPLDSLHPRQIDERYVELLGEYNSLQRRLASASSSVAYTKERMATAERAGRDAPWFAHELAQHETKLAEAQERVRDMGDALDIYEDEYRDRGGWTRGFLVTSSNGHVHKTRHCSTCLPTTEFALLPHYSGGTEEQLVSDAGEKACTTCYPSAPVDQLARASRLVGDEAREAREAAAARKVEIAKAKAAKGITGPDGGELRIPSSYSYKPGMTDLIKTEATAQKEAVDELMNVYTLVTPGAHQPWPERQKERQERIEGRLPLLINALARKRGQEPEQVLAELAPKAAAKFKRYYDRAVDKTQPMPKWLTDAIGI